MIKMGTSFRHIWVKIHYLEVVCDGPVTTGGSVGLDVTTG